MVFLYPRDLGNRCAPALFRRTPDVSRDPKLRWLKLERTDDRLLVAERPCVCKTSKRTPDDDVTTCDDLSAPGFTSPRSVM